MRGASATGGQQRGAGHHGPPPASEGGAHDLAGSGGGATTEREAHELLFARYSATRARYLVGLLRLLVLYSEEGLVRRGWITQQGLDPGLRDLRLAGVAWPLRPAGEQPEGREAVPARDAGAAADDRGLAGT